MRRIAPLVLIVGSLFLICGCTGGDGGQVKIPPLGKVQGKVTLDGNPLANAIVEFDSTMGHPSRGTTDSGGVYSLAYDESHPGAAVGENTVRITTATGAAAAGAVEKVPAKYNEGRELKATVKEGNNTFDFDLKSN